MLKRLSFLVLTVSLLGATSCKKFKDPVIYTASVPMTPVQVVPVQTTPATSSGTINASYNMDTRVLTYTINYSGLSSVIKAVHVHGPAEPGYNGALLQNITSGLPTTLTGSYTGTVTMDNVVLKEEDLLANRYFIDVHTNNYPAAGVAELRGQLNIK